MPGASDSAYGNEKMDMLLYLPAVTFPTLGVNASADNTFVVPGVLPLDILSWNMQNPPVHLTIDNMYVSSPNTITIRWGTDATGIATATVVIAMTVTRATNANLGASALPAAIV
jgi:hypothetical protein